MPLAPGIAYVNLGISKPVCGYNRKSQPTLAVAFPSKNKKGLPMPRFRSALLLCVSASLGLAPAALADTAVPSDFNGDGFPIC